MNMVSALGLYAAVIKETGKPFILSASPSFYTMFDCVTDAGLLKRNGLSCEVGW